MADKYKLSTPLTVLYVAIYIITGILAPIVLDVIRDEGGAEKLALLYPLPNSIGMALTAIFPCKDSHYNRALSLLKYPREIVVMTLIDVVATTTTLFGQLMVGSGLKNIIYSSITIWSAVGSLILMKRRLTVWMWIGVVVVTVGLMLSGVGALTSFGTDKLIGMVIVLVGTILHSCMYWVTEYFCITRMHPIHPRILAGYVGMFGLSTYAAYIMLYTIPHWDSLFVEPVERAGGNYWHIALLYLALTIMEWMHLYAQFTAVVSLGAVMVGVNKAASSAGVFVLSHLVFCSSDPVQCIDVYKVVSLLLVLGGVVLYTLASGKQKQHKQIAGEIKEAMELSSDEQASEPSVLTGVLTGQGGSEGASTRAGTGTGADKPPKRKRKVRG